jgi:hypothetical protein
VEIWYLPTKPIHYPFSFLKFVNQNFKSGAGNLYTRSFRTGQTSTPTNLVQQDLNLFLLFLGHTLSILCMWSFRTCMDIRFLLAFGRSFCVLLDNSLDSGAGSLSIKGPPPILSYLSGGGGSLTLISTPPPPSLNSRLCIKSPHPASKK